MKEIILSITFLLFLLQSFGQLPTEQALTKSDYMLKNRQQKTVGWVLLAGGFTSILLGSAIAAGDALNGNSSGSSGADFIALTGIGAMVGSIPLFISARKNKRKAAALSFTNQKLLHLQAKAVATKMQPALTLKVSL